MSFRRDRGGVGVTGSGKRSGCFETKEEVDAGRRRENVEASRAIVQRLRPETVTIIPEWSWEWYGGGAPDQNVGKDATSWMRVGRERMGLKGANNQRCEKRFGMDLLLLSTGGMRCTLFSLRMRTERFRSSQAVSRPVGTSFQYANDVEDPAYE